jgi:hypothetical protein
MARKKRMQIQLAMLTELYSDRELVSRRLVQRLICLEAAEDSFENDESLLQEIRDTREIIYRYEEQLKELNQEELERYQDPPQEEFDRRAS